MTDVFTPRERSEVMRAVLSEDTKPEMAVRQLVHRLGFRYRLHVRFLPGHPDMVFPSKSKIIFVNGCFWHRHRCKQGRSMPASRIDYWERKFSKNRIRDRKNRERLRRLGWKVLVVWECQTTNISKMANRIVNFLGKA